LSTINQTTVGDQTVNQIDHQKSSTSTVGSSDYSENTAISMAQASLNSVNQVAASSMYQQNTAVAEVAETSAMSNLNRLSRQTNIDQLNLTDKKLTSDEGMQSKNFSLQMNADTAETQSDKSLVSVSGLSDSPTQGGASILRNDSNNQSKRN